MEEEEEVWDRERMDLVVVLGEEVVLEEVGTLDKALSLMGSGGGESRYLMGLEEGVEEDGDLAGDLGVAEGADTEQGSQ